MIEQQNMNWGKKVFFGNTKWSIVALSAVLCFITALPAFAEIQGSCDGYYTGSRFSGAEVRGEYDPLTGKVTRNDPLPIIRDQAPVFETPNEDALIVSSIPFGDRVFLTEYQDGFYLVNTDLRYGDRELQGWVKADDILCNANAVKNDEGIYRKFYVRTQASFQGEAVRGLVPVTAPGGDQCVSITGVECLQLTRFTLYYVYAIDPVTESVLLMPTPDSRGETLIVGWVSIESGYLWDTRLGLRPKENLVFDRDIGEWQAGEERRVCLFETLEEASLAKELRDASDDSGPCTVPILGGSRWFNYALRIPVFELVDYGDAQYYHVALPSAGVGSDATDDILTQIQGLDEAIRLLQNMSNLDVFFLMDGTESMEPHLESIVGTEGKPGVLEAIQDAFSNDPRFERVQIRYGYRVYRDHYAGNYGIGAGMPFGSSCKLTDDEISANHAQFQAEVQLIDAKFFDPNEKPDTDHEENLIMGLAIAADDMAECPEHVKLLFVIGDTGYDLETQIERGSLVGSEEEVLSYLTQSFSSEVDPVIPFFIQVPKAPEQLQLTGERLERYETAYNKFTDQALFFTRRIGEHFSEAIGGNLELDIEENFFSLDGSDPDASQEALVEYILERVSQFGDQRPVNEIIAEIQGGSALVDIILALQSGGNNVPALRLAQIENRICEELGSSCTERIYNDVTEGYIEAGDDIRLDIWVTGEEFRKWRERLDYLRNTNELQITEIGDIIIQMMVDGLKGSLGDLSPAEMQLSLAEFLDLKQGLPTSSQTPLLNYSIGDFIFSEDVVLRDDDRPLVEPCELYRVARWLERHREIFDSIENNEVPIFDLLDVTSCEMRYDTPELMSQGRERFPEDSMSYRQALMGETIFWIPTELLP